MIGGMKPSSRERSPCTGSPCIGSAATILTSSPSSSLSRRPLPISVPPVPRPATKAADLVELLEDLERRAVVVRERVGLVAVLVGHVVRGVVLGQVEGHLDGAVRALGALRVDDLGAIHPQQLGALGSDVVGHHDLQRVALARADHRERDPGVARGRLEDRLTGPDQALLLGVLDQRPRDAVLDGARRVARLELGPEPHAGLRGEALELDQRRMPDRLDDVPVAAAARPVLKLRAHTSRSIAAAVHGSAGYVRIRPGSGISQPTSQGRGRDHREGQNIS